MDSVQAAAREQTLVRRPWLAVAVILLVFLALDNLQQLLSLSDSYCQLYDELPSYFRRAARIALQIALCLAVVRLFWTTSVAAAARELGFNGRVIDGILFGFGASAPMFAGALGGWYAFSLQSASIVLAVGLTLRWTERLNPAIPDRGQSRDGIIAGRYHAERDANESQRQK